MYMYDANRAQNGALIMLQTLSSDQIRRLLRLVFQYLERPWLILVLCFLSKLETFVWPGRYR